MTLASRAGSLVELIPRPLDPIQSIKLKLSILLLGSGAAGIGYLWYQYRWMPPVVITLITVAVVLATVQVLAHGMTRPLREMTAAAQEMARGDYTRRVRATARDEVGELAAAFNQMAADLAAADRQRRELIGNVSHELRTPIAALQAVLENVIDGVSGPEALDGALAHTERLGRLVADLLDLSRIDAGAVSLRRETFPLAPLLAATVAETRLAAGGDVGFDVTLTPPDLTTHADRARLHQVLANLLDNAVRHGPPCGVVGIRARAHGAGGIVLDVADQGPGIAPADRERVFLRFTRGERAGGGGTGLGLAIARWVIDLHGGRITVVDPPARADPTAPGCHIRITLPPPG